MVAAALELHLDGRPPIVIREALLAMRGHGSQGKGIGATDDEPRGAA
jgi:hypothetical protein